MKQTLLFIPLFIFYAVAFCQDGVEIIRQVKKAQEFIRTISYVLERTDTLVTGDIRTMRGQAMIRADKNDSLFGFEFQARQEGVHGESVYGGRIVYETDDSEKVYKVITNPSLLPHVLWQYSGRIILTDLVRLDTTGAIGFETWRDQQFIYLRLKYADLTQYDVVKRSKTLTIDPTTLLPVAMRSHQETLGKVQDLYYRIKEIHVNDLSFQYDFSLPPFVAKYSQRIQEPARPLLSMEGQEAPAFVLSSFADQKISLSGLRGKAVLLDFWEVWCGPCVESMPKVQHLYDVYKDKGLQVFGVINEVKQLEPSRLLVQKKGIHFPMLIGNEQLKKDYKLEAIPMYVLIDKTGKIVFVGLGYSDELEAAIQKALAG